MRFLVVKLSESAEGRKDVDNNTSKSHLAQKEPTSYACKATSNRLDDGDNAVGEHENKQIAGKLSGSVNATVLQHECVESSKKENFCSTDAVKGHSEESGNPKNVSCSDGENVKAENMSVPQLEKLLSSLHVQLSELKGRVNKLEDEEKMLVGAKLVKDMQVQKAEHDYEILKAAVDMAHNDQQDQHSVGYFIKQLNEQAESKRSCLKYKPEERRMTCGLSSHNLESEVLRKLNQLKDSGRETEETISEINMRELEQANLLEELKKMPKLLRRESYIERITEITRNSWKQDGDIDRILKETRELQLESNSIRERVARTYAVVDETVFREAKKDAMGRQVYRLLTSIHDSFEQISDNILAADRAQREAAEQEAKLAALSSRSMDIDKLQADLDSIRKENELLEQRRQRD